MPIIRVKPTKDGYRSGGPWTLVGSDWLAAIENADGSAYHTANSVTRNSLSLTGAKTFDFSQIPDDAVINAIRGIAIFRWVTGTGYSNITARLERGSAAGVISDIVTQDGGTGAWIELATPWATPTIPEHATGADIKASNERLSTELIMNWRMTNGGNKLQSFDVDQLAIDVDYTVAVTPDRFGTGSVSSTSVTTYSASKSTLSLIHI